MIEPQLVGVCTDALDKRPNGPCLGSPLSADFATLDKSVQELEQCLEQGREGLPDEAWAEMVFKTLYAALD
jgi:hypothetical protein